VFERDILSKLFLVNWKPDSQVDIVCLFVCLFEQTHFFNYMVFGCTLGQSPLVLLLSPGPQYWKKRHQLSFLVHPLKSKIYFKPFSCSTAASQQQMALNFELVASDQLFSAVLASCK
jgi:hypothetical protein